MPVLSFVIGGAASGKSAFAEQLTRRVGKPKTYIATLQPFDPEMHEKVAVHQESRGADWTTIEAHLDVVSVIESAKPDQIILLDCVTLWLTNVLLADMDMDAEIAALVAALGDAPCDVVVVSNEVGMGIVPDNALSRRFRNAQGKVNRLIAGAADNVITVIAGLPLGLKGDCDMITPARVLHGGTN